ncbi:MAG: hypothetical protein ACXVLQ_15950 [Bacteriovorax sp.]
MYNFSEYPEWIRLFETPHIKVIANSNQYYLGRLILATKTDEKDGDKLNQELQGQKFKLYPSMDYIMNERRDVYNEMLDVLSALNKGRRVWLHSQGLDEGLTLFNELTADNLSYCENRKEVSEKGKNNEECRETFHHAHMHSIPRYKKKILLTYDKKAAPVIRLSYYDGKNPVFTAEEGALKFERNKDGPEKVWVLFKDTEYGDIIDFKKKLVLVDANESDSASKGKLEKIKTEIQIWIVRSISQASLPFLKKYFP